MPRKSFLLRIDQKLYNELKRLADSELRSVNGQIEFMLRRAVNERLRRKEEDDADSAAD